ncbi:hypothetical protein [Macrococcoides canis]|uniref:Nuclear transport factor 2 family protein n=1 Tax=Macrococcoides canis TaxID=1855823 RepID=A0A4R6C3M1_9STAP|nr:hypothetical protein [Macrococcus canis]MEE1107164.1 hypothetical protein [Macrococcus canis]TDM16105.1 hypothetical protein ETI04_09310 [Macrococcus canis]TDM30911.1 hypothetical protein ETI03_07670 [Macrococcus canis]TDM33806.1 hypothetical protein ETI13_07530 [Macrococcus canis]TDM37329.1 hypothetical protein ETI11_06580 [Macrococcus canis]
MDHINFFINWKNQDLENIKKQFSESLKATFVLNVDREVTYNYSQTVNLLEKRFEGEQNWNFDIMRKYTRNDECIVITNIICEDQSYQLKEPLSVCILTFKDHKLIRMYMETGLSSD